MTNTELTTKVRESITAVIPNKPSYLLIVGTGETLESLGFDTLDRHEIALKIEQEFSIDIEDGVPEAWSTVQDVIDSVSNELGSRNPADIIKNHWDLEETPALAEMRDYCNEMVPNPDYKPVINRIERVDVDKFRANCTHPKNATDWYQTIATKSAIYPGKGTPFGLMYAALGLAEAGEVQNKVKKAFRDDGVIEFREHLPGDPTANTYDEMSVVCRPITPERRAQIIKELGGAMWYIAAVCNEIGATMSEVALGNLDELCGRGERDTLRGDGDNR